MTAINEKRMNWRKVAEECGEQTNTLRACIVDLRTAFREWEYDLADGADQRYQARVQAIFAAVGLPTTLSCSPITSHAGLPAKRV